MAPDREKVRRKSNEFDSAVRVSQVERSEREMDVEKCWLDQALVDIGAFDKFYIKYRIEVLRFIRSETTDQNIVDDLTSETFLRAMMKLNSFTWQKYLLKSWLLGIARNVVKQETRRKSSRAEIQFDQIRHDVSDGGMAGYSTSAFALFENFGNYKTRLSKAQVKIFEMYYEDEMTIKEICIETGTPEPTVKSRLQRGRKRLKRMLIPRKIER